jgi:hypothetical protein
MQRSTDTTVRPPSATLPPVDDLLRLYLGAPAGVRASDTDRGWADADARELWDRLGDFA